ncbi:hypothetical protein AB0J86_35220 [Micromonospora sp. NPDC049559]|uniref:hypothetical protein n=1 Tax=Micromonospora sp. NPDC049559 TaxID=3155923 RepID=UPI00343C3551
MVVTFRPTWRQALACGLCPGLLGSLALALAALAVPVLLEAVAGRPPQPAVPPAPVWLAALAPVPLGLLGGVLARRRVGARIDESGVRCGSPDAVRFAPWRAVVDVRAERRRYRTAVAVYLYDGSILRLRAPYDGCLLGRDPMFERKLFMICHLWATHRDWSRPG